jgi:hypothetical protein
VRIEEMRKLKKEIEDFRSDDSGPDALTWEHSAVCIALLLAWQLVDTINDIWNEIVEANNKL